MLGIAGYYSKLWAGGQRCTRGLGLESEDTRISRSERQTKAECCHVLLKAQKLGC